MTLDEIVREYGDRLVGDNGKNLLGRYRYQPALTNKLDAIERADFSAETMYEIVLWKTDRFPELTSELLYEVNELKEITSLQGEDLVKARRTLKSLLRTKGMQLPMASTVLRFRNRRVFQIIDERTFRIVCSDKPSYPSKPYKLSNGYLETSADIYFDYLSTLKEVAIALSLDFMNMDRILYQLDIELGNTLDR